MFGELLEVPKSDRQWATKATGRMNEKNKDGEKRSTPFQRMLKLP